MGELARNNRAFASCVHLVCGLLAVSAPASATQFAGGAGQPDNPYQIATAEQLIAVGQDPNLLDKHFTLANDLDLDANSSGGRVFTKAVIASSESSTRDFNGTVFTGSLDGKGHRIRHLTIQGGGTGHLGLFGKTGRSAEIRALILEDVRISNANSYGAGLVGDNGGDITNCRVTGALSGEAGQWCYCLGLVAGANQGRIIGCHAEGRMVSASANRGLFLGLLVGDNWGHLQDCTADGTIVGGDTFNGVGGLIGENAGSLADCHAAVTLSMNSKDRTCGNYGGLAGANSGSICRSYATGDVTCGTCAKMAGGLVGYNTGILFGCCATGRVAGTGGNNQLGGLTGMNGGHILSSYARGDITGGMQLGGLVGLNWGTISQCYSTGRVTGGKESRVSKGGLVGGGTGDRRGSVACSFWDTKTSGMDTSKGGMGLMSAQMKDHRMFLTAGWDFVSERANGTADLWRMPQTNAPPELTFFSPGYPRHTLQGAGTTDAPYRITDAEDLGAICHHDPGACYQLVADVNLAGITWTVPVIPSFQGRFDGNGCTVSNLSLRGDCFLGLFGVLGRTAVVEKLQIDKARIVAGNSASGLGLLAVENWGRISNCRVVGDITRPKEAAKYAGLVDENHGTITDCDPLGNDGAYTTIISDPKATRRFLNWEGIAFDDIWIPADKDLDRLDTTLQTYLKDNTPIPARTWMDRKYVLTHFREYDREYSGFIIRGRKYIICQMHLFPGDRRGATPRKEFSIIMDGGCGIVIIVFDAETKAIISIDCNGEV